MINSAGYPAAVNRPDNVDHVHRTASAMHDTAEQMEVVEDALHTRAEQARDPETTARVHALGDSVTTQAKDVDRRADQLERD
ncbi:hypothetical protein ACQP2E_20525 [Actinoplanes sp. CA-015351]|uniref:hypothetical protein n=1 Tax=Actinoplanes sp. CA-015351 TaxID=3239897 RepID=UPI003D96B195